jgi:hypothetical protein
MAHDGRPLIIPASTYLLTSVLVVVYACSQRRRRMLKRHKRALAETLPHLTLPVQLCDIPPRCTMPVKSVLSSRFTLAELGAYHPPPLPFPRIKRNAIRKTWRKRPDANPDKKLNTAEECKRSTIGTPGSFSHPFTGTVTPSRGACQGY